MDKLLSVSIAAYNVEKFIEECMNSFLDKEILEACEILVINDGSTDQTADIVMKYVKKYPQAFQLINKNNGGWGSTLNSGIMAARGKYFRQLDADDRLNMSNLRQLLHMLKDIDTDIVCTPYAGFDDETGKFVFLKEFSTKLSMGEVYQIKDVLDDIIDQMHALTVKTKVLQMNGIRITEKCFYTDVEFILKSINNSETISFYNLPLYEYRVNLDGQSMSRAGIRRHYKEHQKALMVNLDYVKEHGRKELENFFHKRLSYMVSYQYRCYMFLDINRKHKKELKSFDAVLYERYPEFYKCESKIASILRKTKFIGYSLMALLYRLKG